MAMRVKENNIVNIPIEKRPLAQTIANSPKRRLETVLSHDAAPVIRID